MKGVVAKNHFEQKALSVEFRASRSAVPIGGHVPVLLMTDIDIEMRPPIGKIERREAQLLACNLADDGTTAMISGAD